MARRRSGSGGAGEQNGLWELSVPPGDDRAEISPEPDPGPGPARAPGAVVLVSEEVEERVVARQCAGCDRPVPVRATGRPARWCSQACRQRGWALRAAAAQLGRPELAEPRIVREVVERAVVRTLVPAPEPEPDPELEPEPDDELADEPGDGREAGPGAGGYSRVYVTPPWVRRTSPDVSEGQDVPVASPAEPAVPVVPPGPRRGREWAELLDTLTAGLQEPGSPVAVEHWHHQRLQAALVRALTALDQAHPGGLRGPRR